MRRMITSKQAQLFDYVVQDGNTTQIGGNVEIDGNLVVNGEGAGGTKIYKHTLLCFTYGDQPITIISTREAPYTLNDLDGSGINDAIIMYATSGPFTTGGIFFNVYYMDDYIHAEQIVGEPIHAAIRSDGEPIADNVVEL